MLILFAVILGGIVAGRLFSKRRLVFVQPLIMGIIRVLLFLLGAEIGSDPAIVQGMATLGRTAFMLFAGSVAGSIAAAWLLGRTVCRSAPDSGEDETAENLPETNSLAALKGSTIIVLFFLAGCVAGWADMFPRVITDTHVSAYVLYFLMFTVGISLGCDRTLASRIRRLNPRLALLPVATAVGTLAGAALATPLLAPVTVGDSLAVGAGFGYYSLSGIFIADLRSVELGTVALLCNVMREIFTLLAAPFVARLFGPLAAISIGGATSFDTTLPVITQAVGRPYAVVSIFHGCVLDFSVPLLVTLFCTI